MNLPKLDYNKIVSHFTLGLDVLFVLFVLASYFGGVAGAWSEIVGYVFYFVVAVNTLFFALKIKAIPEKERGDSKMIYYFSHFFLLSLVVIVVNQFLKRAWIIDNLNYITAVSIAFGFLTFYAYRNKVEREIEKESKDEEKAERKREREFGGKFKRLAWFDFDYGVKGKWKGGKYLSFLWRLMLSPFVFVGRFPFSFVRWMYKEGWLYSWGLIAIVVVGFVLRIWVVGDIDLNGDEYRHLNAMKHFFSNGYFEQPRSIITSYILIAVKYFVSYENYFAFKLPFVIFGTFTVLLMYFLSKNYISNKKISLFSSYLFATLPLAIGLARYIREYELSILLMIVSLLVIKRYGSLLVNIIIFIFWAFFYELLGGTSIVVFGVIMIFLFIDFVKFLFSYFKKKGNLKIVKFFILGLSLVLILFCIFQNNLINIHTLNKGFLFLFNYSSIIHNFDSNPIGYTWFIELVSFWFIILILSFFICHICLSKSLLKKIDNFGIVIIFLFSLVYFLFIGNFPFTWQARYIYYIVPFYIVILAISYFYFCKILKLILKKNYLYCIIIVMIFLFLFSPYNALHNLATETSGEPDPFQGQQIYSERELCSFLNNEKISAEEIIVSRSWSLDYCFDAPFLSENEKKEYIFFPEGEFFEYYDRTKIFMLSSYNSFEWKEKILNIMNNHNISHIIISRDSYRNYPNFSLPINGSLKLIKEIPEGDYRYKYFIYKIND